MVIAGIPYKLYRLIPGILLLISSSLAMAQEPLLDRFIYLESQIETIGNLLSQIGKEGNLTFGYGNVVPSRNVVNLEGGRRTIREFLDQVLQGIPVKYEERHGKILLLRGPPSLTVRGIVRDMESGAPLIGANVIILEAGPLTGVITDTNGQFTFEKNIPVGRYNFKASYMGYQYVSMHDVLVGSGRELFLEFNLKERIEELPEARIQQGNRKNEPRNDMATVSARSFTVEEAKRFPAAVNDPARMVLVYPGVKTGDEDIFNELVIRCNSPSSVLWRMEGIEIFVPNHFAVERSTTGWINILSSNLLGRSDFLTGAFPAEYGNALGGVFDMSLRNGNNRRNEYSLQAGMLGTELSAEGPFRKDYDGSYLLNYRYNTTFLVNKMLGAFGEGLIPQYWDVCYKIHLPTRKFGNFSLWGLGGQGYASNAGEGNADAISRKTHSVMSAGGLTHLWFPNEDSYLKSTIAFSMNKTNYAEDSLVPVRASVDYQDFSIAALRASLMYRYKINPKLSVKLGGTASRLMYDYVQKGQYPGRVNSAGSTWTFQGYLQGKYYLAEDLHVNAGLHFFHFKLNGDALLEPRLGIRWDFLPDQSIGFGFGMHSQVDYLSSYFQEAQRSDGTYAMPNRELGLAKAIHYILSYDNSLLRNIQVKTELYYQDLYNLPVKKTSPYTKAPVNSEYPMDTLINIGTGRNYGFELTVEKNFSRGYYFLVSSSLYDSKVDPGNDTLYHTCYNAGFAQNAVGGKEFKVGRNRQDIVGINAKVIWTGGNRGQKYNTDSTMLLAARYETQYDDYFRLDVNFIYRLHRPRASHVFSIDIQNLCNRNNIMRINFDFEQRKFMIDHHEFGIFPFFSYKVEF